MPSCYTLHLLIKYTHIFRIYYIYYKFVTYRNEGIITSFYFLFNYTLLPELAVNHCDTTTWQYRSESVSVYLYSPD